VIVLMILSACKQTNTEWILSKIMKLEIYTQNAHNAFIEIYVQFYYACMWLHMTMCAHKIIL
jgi:hypothetical protein